MCIISAANLQLSICIQDGSNFADFGISLRTLSPHSLIIAQKVEGLYRSASCVFEALHMALFMNVACNVVKITMRHAEVVLSELTVGE